MSLAKNCRKKAQYSNLFAKKRIVTNFSPKYSWTSKCERLPRVGIWCLRLSVADIWNISQSVSVMCFSVSLCYWSCIHLPCSQIFLNVWSLSFILFLSYCSYFTFVKIFLNSGKESKVQEQTKDSNYQKELLHVEIVSVMVNMDLREIKSVLLLSYQIFKITVEQCWHRLTEMFHICLHKWCRG